MTVTHEVRDAVPDACITRSCREQGCSLSLNGTSRQAFAIDMNHDDAPINRNQTHCDFLFVGSLAGESEEWVVPIELKRGEIGASEARDQLQAGADAADRLVPRDLELTFLPLAVSGSMARAERDQLRKSSHRIRFRRQMVLVERTRCGSDLADVLRRG